jgi:glycosyltransferase involved in cell wall biosynthesis
MRVALLSHTAPAGDAIGRQLAAKVAFFADRGADVRLFVESDARLHPGLRPYTQRFAPPRPHGPHWRFLTAADLIIVEYSQYYPLLDLLPLLAGGRPRLVFDYHGVTPPDLGGANHRDALERGGRLRGLAWFADAALAHSRFARDELLSATGFPAEATHTLGYAVDDAAFTPGLAEVPLRPQLGLPPDARLLLFVGRLAPNKRVPVLVEALAHLRDLMPPVHAVIVGDCGGTYEPERQRCRERAAHLGVADRLHFLGHVDERQLRDAYRDADVFVMPSMHEGFCIPVVEALACGTPVVAARAAALPETVGDAGLTFTPGDAADLARQVRRWLDPASQRPATGSAVARICCSRPLRGRVRDRRAPHRPRRPALRRWLRRRRGDVATHARRAHEGRRPRRRGLHHRHHRVHGLQQRPAGPPLPPRLSRPRPPRRRRPRPAAARRPGERGGRSHLPAPLTAIIPARRRPARARPVRRCRRRPVPARPDPRRGR